MDFNGVDIVCPSCRADLELHGDLARGTLRCRGCGREYPVLVGIPDLRLWPDPYIGFDDDRAKGVRLAQECQNRSFAESVRYYYSVTHAVPPFQARRFERGLLAASARSRAWLDQWESRAQSHDQGLTLLDVGCGTAPLLVNAAGRYARVVGVDIAFRWLVLAQRRLAEAGMEVPLICACAEALPFRDAQFDRVVADSTLELVADLPRSASEVQRVLRPDGHAFVGTPNRFFIGPDPHVGVMAGGWWPERLISRYVQFRGGVPPHRTLLSRRTLRRLLEEAGLTVRALYAPALPAALRDRVPAAARPLVDGYNVFARLPLTGLAVQAAGPLLHAVAVKERDR